MGAATVLELVGIAENVYRDSSDGSAGARWKRISDSTVTDAEGFFGALYECGANLVVAYRGTSMDSIEDLEADVMIVSDKAPKQFSSAQKLFEAGRTASATAGKEVVITGHSLGGGLTQLAAAHYSVLGVAFNPPGMKNVARDNGIKLESERVLNVVMRWDPVSSFGTRIGRKLRLNEQGKKVGWWPLSWPSESDVSSAHHIATVVHAVGLSSYRDQDPAAVYDALG